MKHSIEREQTKGESTLNSWKLGRRNSDSDSTGNTRCCVRSVVEARHLTGTDGEDLTTSSRKAKNGAEARRSEVEAMKLFWAKSTSVRGVVMRKRKKRRIGERSKKKKEERERVGRKWEDVERYRM